MKYELEATIPVAPYGNIKPKFTIEDGDDGVAMEKIKDLWNKYGEKPINENGIGGETMDSFTGESVIYNDDTHIYSTVDGRILLSGSQYAESVSPKFDKAQVLPRTAKAWEVDEKSLDDIWGKLGKVSTSLGTSIHDALELYHLHSDVGEVVMGKKELESNYVLSKNPYIKDVVLKFVDSFGTDAEVEVLVTDVGQLRAGRIDRLEIIDKKKKVCRIGDYKTNGELDSKKLLKYQHQLSFYAHILMNHGWTVEGLDIFHLDGDWVKHELEVLDLK